MRRETETPPSAPGHPLQFYRFAFACAWTGLCAFRVVHHTSCSNRLGCRVKKGNDAESWDCFTVSFRDPCLSLISAWVVNLNEF